VEKDCRVEYLKVVILGQALITFGLVNSPDQPGAPQSTLSSSPDAAERFWEVEDYGDCAKTDM
jgi:hypothetical protein